MSHNDRHRDTTVMSPDRQEAAKAQLIAVVNGDTSTRRRPPKPLLIGAAILVGAAASVGAVSLLTHAPVTDPYTVECRTSLDPDEEGNYIATVTPLTITGGVTHTLPRPELQDAINICAQLIATGWPAQTDNPPSFTDGPPTGRPDDMTLCVADDGHAVIVPSPDTTICGQLGLSGGPA